MTDNEKLIEEDGRIRIWVNSNTGMSRGKYAAAAVHAALTAAGVHPGVPVIVLGGQRGHIERMRTVIRDAGRTEVEPGTTTAGTDYVFEKAHTPTDDELQLAERLVARLLPARQEPGTAANIVRYLAEAGLLRHSEVPEPSTEDYPDAERRYSHDGSEVVPGSPAWMVAPIRYHGSRPEQFQAGLRGREMNLSRRDKADLAEGLRQSAAGETVSLGSFDQFADEEVDGGSDAL